MKIQWTEQAGSDLTEALDFIARDRPGAAEHVLDRITASVDRLQQFPSLGKMGRQSGTRELVIPGLPFVVPYMVRAGNIIVLSILHTSRDYSVS